MAKLFPQLSILVQFRPYVDVAPHVETMHALNKPLGASVNVGIFIAISSALHEHIKNLNMPIYPYITQYV